MEGDEGGQLLELLELTARSPVAKTYGLFWRAGSTLSHLSRYWVESAPSSTWLSLAQEVETNRTANSTSRFRPQSHIANDIVNHSIRNVYMNLLDESDAVRDSVSVLLKRIVYTFQSRLRKEHYVGEMDPQRQGVLLRSP